MSETVPPLNDPRWATVLKEQNAYTFEFLATNLIFARLRLSAHRDPSEKNISRVATELWQIFSKNSHNPKVQKDVKEIFGRKTSDL